VVKLHSYHIRATLCAFGVVLLCQCSEEKRLLSGPADELSHQVEALTGSHTRIVWAQHSRENEADPFAITDRLILRGLDTRDGQGDRVILSTPANYSRPLLCPDGEHILYTDKNTVRKGDDKSYKPEVFLTDWAGSAPRKLGSGYAVDCWKDPATDKVWVYAVESFKSGKSLALFAQRLVRFPLDEPERREQVFEDAKLSPDNIQLSSCGTMASGMAPWPHAGLIELKEAGADFSKIGFGCWTSLSPDESGLMWVLQGNHREVKMLSGRGSETWPLQINGHPDMKGGEMYHPRWSNHPRVIAVTGPYIKAPGVSGSVVNKGGSVADVYLGRLSQDARSVESWVRITDSGRGDAYPDVWVAGEHPSDALMASVSPPDIR